MWLLLIAGWTSRTNIDFQIKLLQVSNSIMSRSDCRLPMPSQCANLPMFKRLVQDDGWCVMCVQPQPGHYSCIYHPAGVHMRRRPRYPGSCSSALHGPSSPPATGSPQLQAAAVPGDTEVSTGGHLHTPWTPPGHPLPSPGHVKCRHQVVVPRPAKASLHSHHLGSNACWNFNSV